MRFLTLGKEQQQLIAIENRSKRLKIVVFPKELELMLRHKRHFNYVFYYFLLSLDVSLAGTKAHKIRTKQ